MKFWLWLFKLKYHDLINFGTFDILFGIFYGQVCANTEFKQIKHTFQEWDTLPRTSSLFST